MTATWWRVTVTGGPDQADSIAATLIAATGQGVEERQSGTVCTTVASESEANAIVQRVQREHRGVETSIAAEAIVDWSMRWRDGIVTRTFGRLVLTPSWLPVEPDSHRVVVTIDPESAFGSGEHGSTRGALALIERHVRAGDRVLDFGSGSGILSIAAVKLGARSAIGIEMDEASIPIAEANARKNQVSESVRFLAGDAALLGPLAGPAELVCSNILRSVNTALLPVIRAVLARNGFAILAGMEAAEESLMYPVLAQHRMSVIDTVCDAGWWSVAVRPS